MIQRGVALRSKSTPFVNNEDRRAKAPLLFGWYFVCYKDRRAKAPEYKQSADATSNLNFPDRYSITAKGYLMIAGGYLIMSGAFLNLAGR